MPGFNGIAVPRQIVDEFPHSKVIALSIHSAQRFVNGMLRARAVGYLLKEGVSAELLQGIKAVMRGDVYLSGTVIGAMVEVYVKWMFSENLVKNVKARHLLRMQQLNYFLPFSRSREIFLPHPHAIILLEKNSGES